MKKLKNWIYYLIVSGFFFLCIRFILNLAVKKGVAAPPPVQSSWQHFLLTLDHALHHPLAILLLQIITIVAAARLLGYLFNKMRQPAVIGEIVAGILLGPTLLGHYLPEVSGFIFPPDSEGNLQFLSQIGLVLFMFAVGMELDFGILKGKAKDALIISHTGIWLSFTLGILLAYFFYDRYAPEDTPFISFALFTGTAMSITAFPVLARVVQERGLLRKPLGSLALTSAAVDDITAWCLLAAVVAVVKAGTATGAMYNILFTLVYVLFMLLLVRPFMKRVGEVYNRKKTMSRWIIAISFLVLLFSAYVADLLGIHALFGAFLAGIVMPPSLNFRRILTEKTEDVALVLFLPLFFVYSGLRTKLGLLNSTQLWLDTAWVVAFAVGGKFIGAFAAARFSRYPLFESLSLGALMNTRGLMELVVLNIGLDLGVLSPEIFSMLVVMALLTTFMTGPLLELIQYFFKPKEKEEPRHKPRYKVLVSFANPAKAVKLLRIASGFAGRGDQGLITALHLSHTDEINPLEAPKVEAEVFSPIRQAARELNLDVQPVHKFTHDFSRDLMSIAHKGHYDLLLMGAGQSIYQGSLLGNIVGITAKALNPEKLLGTITGKETILPGDELFDDKTRLFLEGGKCSVGVYIDRNLKTLNRIFIPITGNADMFLLVYARRLQKNAGSAIVLYDPELVLDEELLHEDLQPGKPDTEVELLRQRQVLNRAFTGDADLLLVSHPGWKSLLAGKRVDTGDLPSTLIVRP